MGNSEKYEDKTLTCADCNKEFEWSASEQEFFAEKKFAPPKRCLECRQKRRKEKKERRGNSRPAKRGDQR